MRAQHACPLLGAVLLASPAAASTAQVTFCAEYTVDIADASSAVGDDFWTDSGPKKARGAKFKIKDSADTLVHEEFLRAEPPNIGCTDGPVTLTIGEHYSLKLLSGADVNGNAVRVRPQGYPDQVYVYDELFIPTADATVTVSTGNGPVWTLTAIAGQVLFRQNGGLSGQTYNLFNVTSVQSGFAFTATSPQGPATTCANASTSDICIMGWARNRKYVVAHEIGHAMAMKAGALMGQGPYTFDYSLAEENCVNTNLASHEMHTREWGSAAAVEGLSGHAFAATVWNDTAQSDCYFNYYRNIDVDSDGVLENATSLNCEAGFVASTWGAFDPWDYYGEVPCSAVEANAGTPYDWLRFGWDMVTDQGLTWADMMSIWVAAEPDTWRVNDHSLPFYLEFPSQRIKLAAYGLGFGVQYEAEDWNGVDR